MNCLVFRLSLPAILLALSSGVSAVGLGELRGHPNLGERPKLEIELLGAEKQNLDSACFRLVQPAGSGDLPWLKKASLSVRKGSPAFLEIRSDTPLSEPILELAVYIGCGHEVSRQYVLLASPVKEGDPPVVESRPRREASPAASVAPRVRPFRPLANPAEAVEAPPRLTVRRAERRPVASGLPDRLMLSSGIDVGEPSLRLATELFSGRAGGVEAKDAQREILRLEFRMLMALNEQATSQMATAEKLRNMESTLGELQQRAAEFAQRVEKEAVPSASPTPRSESPVAAPPVATPEVAVVKRPAPTVEEASSGLSEWSLYGALLGALLGFGGWLGWKNYRQRQAHPGEEAFPILVPAIAVDPRRENESDDAAQLDLHVEPVGIDLPPMQVDLELDGGEPGLTRYSGAQPQVPSMAQDSVMSISATTVDEHFEANPVMELADIMLSFGRVKGAAQALQEYIDNNPEEALQPWIRLMDVYRMAGMRSEFESVAHNLNQHFNVEIQQWEPGQQLHSQASADLTLEAAASSPVAPRPESLEDMPRIMKVVCELWQTGDVVGYLYQLLRDNRGGKRLGFALAVVEEILFLVELKETSNRFE